MGLSFKVTTLTMSNSPDKIRFLGFTLKNGGFAKFDIVKLLGRGEKVGPGYNLWPYLKNEGNRLLNQQAI